MLHNLTGVYFSISVTFYGYRPKKIAKNQIFYGYRPKKSYICVSADNKTMIKRELYLEQIRPFIGRPVIKVIVGIRRCGKSFLLNTLFYHHLLESGVDADALYTLEKGLAIGIFHADCVPVFIYVPSVHLVGIVHAGYEGTLKHIANKFINLIKIKYQLAGSDIYCHIGPCRQFFSFHVNEIEKEKIIASHAEKALRFNGEDDALFDMPFSNIIDLVDAGVPMTNITSCLIDTTDEPNCFSAHVQEKNDGRMASIIMLNE